MEAAAGMQILVFCRTRKAQFLLKTAAKICKNRRMFSTKARPQGADVSCDCNPNANMVGFVEVGKVKNVEPCQAAVQSTNEPCVSGTTSQCQQAVAEAITNDKMKFDREAVTLFHRRSMKAIDVDLKADMQMSLYVRHKGELIDMKVSDSFRQKVRDVHDTMEGAQQNSLSEECNVANPLGSNAIDAKNQLVYYMRLSKVRLTGLVVTTAVAGYLIAPGCMNLTTAALCAVGTGLISASANTINQYLEVSYDSQMVRTRNRPLVVGQVSGQHALLFAGATGLVGTGMLALAVNPLTAGLGVANLVLYTAVYTPMKRWSIVNTWVGSVVGAIPPMMGWAACCGTLHSGAFLLGAIMYAWQFPHFCALSWNLRHDYSRAGYRMVAADNPDLCKRVCLRYSIVLTCLCELAPLLDLTTWWFALDSLPVNAWLCYLAWRFYRDGDSNSSRRLFHYTLVHIPAVLVLMFLCKKHGVADSSATSIEAEKIFGLNQKELSKSEDSSLRQVYFRISSFLSGKAVSAEKANGTSSIVAAGSSNLSALAASSSSS